MDRAEGQATVRTYTVSPDDKNLVLIDVFAVSDGGHEKTTTTYTYARTEPGKSIYGEWKSISMEEETSGEQSFTIQPYGKAGITMTSSGSKYRTDLELDGMQRPDKHSGSTKDETTSGKRVDANHIHIENRVDGKPDDIEDLQLSGDGRILTMVSMALKTSAKFTSVFDKK
jgi:hypothetical protein